MVEGRGRAEDRVMTETQGPPTADQQQTGAGRPGVDRANLRSYETLHRSVTDRKVAGVAGGLGRHLNIDPKILRVLLVVLCLFGGAGFVVYGVAWLIVPEDGREAGILSMSPGTRNAFLVGAGVVAAFVVVGHAWNGVGAPWPLVLVGLALLLYFAFRDRGHGGQAQPPAPYGPGSPYGPGPSSAPGSTYGPAPLNAPAPAGPYGPAPTA